ncbi:hypothetical protein M427DRAFT_110662 [Gonapodya prolifera JEL478]|uniref:UBC core domain-containing protein n=1 Tax=Gonapodya prolifera (strain JEL478) TaxID=1344416 RepID=A0A139AKL9_GONPJ|nr:hypothetical protein M427DRAFT_110662 [Gonapodya prolifera JEL478]|eukprot:KXS17238.1 hypothetical protein M427DRAFT_110662 [Gonapodya prolifera JEL478]
MPPLPLPIATRLKSTDAIKAAQNSNPGGLAGSSSVTKSPISAEPLKAAEALHSDGTHPTSESSQQSGLSSASTTPRRKRSLSAQVCLQNEFSKMLGSDAFGDSVKFSFPSCDDLLNFNVVITPASGPYMGGTFRFGFSTPLTYPYEPPRVKCLQRVYHPNLDRDGNICLGILTDEWKSTMDLNSVVLGVQQLLLEPDAAHPFNLEAAELMIKDPEEFARRVNESMIGNVVGGQFYNRTVGDTTVDEVSEMELDRGHAVA